MHRLAPFGQLGTVKFSERLPHGGRWRHPEIAELFAKRVGAHNVFNFSPKQLGKRRRQPGRGENGPPGVGLEPRQTGLGERRHLRQYRGALATAHSQRAQLPAPHLLQYRLHRIEHQRDLAAEQIGDRRRAAAVGNMLELNAFSLCKQLSSQVSWRTVTRRPENNAGRLSPAAATSSATVV